MERIYNDEELKNFIYLKNGWNRVTKNLLHPRKKKLYSLFYKGTQVPGIVDKNYPLVKWKMQQMIAKGEALKQFLEIKPTKEVPTGKIIAEKQG
jgi:hypothetical protein